MKSKNGIIIMLVSLVFSGGICNSSADAQIYCTPTTDICDEYIWGVQVGDINNIGTACNKYRAYPYSTDMILEESYLAIVIPAIIGEGNYTYWIGDKCGIWIDWNQDMDFYDTGESLVLSEDGYGAFYTIITPPPDALSGVTRMRVRIIYDNPDDGIYNPLSPCSYEQYGEVEDYLVNVLGSEINGYKFNDLNGNSVWDDDEPALPGWDIYLDLNGNGDLDGDEPNHVTDEYGYYEFIGLSPDTYTVAEVDQPGWRQTFPPGDGTHTITLGSSDIDPNNHFGNMVSDTTIVELVAIEDTYASSLNPDTNYGNNTSLSAGVSDTTTHRSFVKFDLSVIPPGQVIRSAEIRLNNHSITVPAPFLGIYDTSDKWEEDTLTWNNMPTYSTSTLIESSIIAGDQTVWNVTPNVDDDYVYDGLCSFLIKSTNENTLGLTNFWSKDLPLDLKPTLIIEYEPIFGGGTGEPDDPYQIWTGEQMNEIGSYSNRWDKHYSLMADISLSGLTYKRIGTSLTTPINGNGGPFRGVFDGNYHSISDFSLNESYNYNGIFGAIYFGTVKNLKIISPDITDDLYDDMDGIGALAGVTMGANIFGCSVIGGSVEGQDYIGGLVGFCDGTFISECSSSAAVSGNSWVGGLVGISISFYDLNNLISDSYATGPVYGYEYIGGFIGVSVFTGVQNCYSTGTVDGTLSIGGFAGHNENTFSTVSENVVGCFWDITTSDITTSSAGIGLETAAMQDINTYLNAGWDFAGELENGGSDDWATPGGGGYPVLWYELPTAPGLPTFAGGSGTVGIPYQIDTVEQLNSIGHNPRLMNKHFILTSNLDCNGIKFYPIADRPYAFSGTFNGNNHTVSGIVVEPAILISRAGFIGMLDGSDAMISDLTLIDPYVSDPLALVVGSLVGQNYGGTITNCHAINTYVEGYTDIGGLVGHNYQYGIISQCSVTGNILGTATSSNITDGVGGLVGENSYWSEIHECSADVNVSGFRYVGGLVGFNFFYVTITNCYAQGNVTGTTDIIGGFIGYNYVSTELSHCYSNCLVTSLSELDFVGSFIGSLRSGENDIYTSCFWDSEINPTLPGIGDGSNPEIVGETTANMLTRSTFTNAGWDFVGETANGTDDIWHNLEGFDYPCFAWQPKAMIVGRHIFYNNCKFDNNNASANPDDDNAIAPDKTALLPGETATAANYTSFSRGINGIMIDIAGLPGTPTASDFVFKVGNDNNPDSWTPAPLPLSITVRLGAGEGYTDRITIVWSDNAIEKKWLQVTVLATANTDLPENDVFYFGNAIGDSCNSIADTYVNAFDTGGVRDNSRNFLNPAPIDDPYDFNRDTNVNALDFGIARNNATNFLTDLNLITVP